MRTQVGIVGAGPAGLFLSHLLERDGIDCVVLEARSRSYVESRVRAGVLERTTVELIRALGLDDRLRRESMIDTALDIRFDGRVVHLDLPELTGGGYVTIYGQQEVVKDLVTARLAGGGAILFEAEATAVQDVGSTRPSIRYRYDGREEILECDFVAGCDGFHGVSRAALPGGALTVFDRLYDVAWFGILSHSPPIKDMTYAHHDRGFALCSRRSPTVSRHYLQCAVDQDPAGWSADQFWDELHIRMGDEDRAEIVEGEIFQRDIARLRAFVAEPMQHGRLFLAGDAVHIVPPTGAKGLNLAAADVRVLARALSDFYANGDRDRLERYSETCLRRVWKTIRFSTYMTALLHRFPAQTDFERRLQLAELDYLSRSRAAATMVAENYVGLPFGED